MEQGSSNSKNFPKFKDPQEFHLITVKFDPKLPMSEDQIRGWVKLSIAYFKAIFGGNLNPIFQIDNRDKSFKETVESQDSPLLN